MCRSRYVLTLMPEAKGGRENEEPYLASGETKGGTSWAI